MDDLYIGLMSGTSMDGVDAALVDLKDGHPKIRATLGKEMPAAIREQLVGFIEQPHKIDLDELGSLDTALGVVFADAAIALLDEVGVPAKKIAAIGSHGQTVRHRPEGEYPFTLQIGDPNVIATRTRICTVADFRRRDVALGGQGAPLTPLFHESVFADPQENRIVLNIGGIANITTLLPDKPVTGFDTGPGNTLMDAWVRRSLGQRCDINGAWAAGGNVVENLLERFLSEPYFSYRPPKSTGTEMFNVNWILAAVEELDDTPSEQDVQATLCELTVRTIADHVEAIEVGRDRTRRLIVCGGGLHNKALMQRLAELLSDWSVDSTSDYGVDPDWVEAVAFAWPAQRTLRGLPGNYPSVTGAAESVVLGAVYPAFS